MSAIEDKQQALSGTNVCNWRAEEIVKSLEFRIESSLPKDRGLKATPTLVTPIPAIKVSLFRIDPEDKAKAYTKIKVQQSYEEGKKAPLYLKPEDGRAPGSK